MYDNAGLDTIEMMAVALGVSVKSLLLLWAMKLQRIL